MYTYVHTIACVIYNVKRIRHQTIPTYNRRYQPTIYTYVYVYVMHMHMYTYMYMSTCFLSETPRFTCKDSHAIHIPYGRNPCGQDSWGVLSAQRVMGVLSPQGLSGETLLIVHE